MPRKYNLVDWSKVKNVYEYVSTGWVEAQRRAEEARGIR